MGILGKDWVRALLINFSVVTFAIAQPLYILKNSNPLDIIAGGVPLLYTVLLVHVAPTALLFSVDRLIVRLPYPAKTLFVYRMVLFLALFLSFGRQIQLFYFQGAFLDVPVTLKYVLVLIALGLVVTLSVFAHRALVMFLVYLSPFALLSTGIFAYQAGLFRGIWQQQSMLASTRSVDHSEPPVFIIILDELSRDVVQKNGMVDAEKFPNLASLAQGGVWFTNATTNYNRSALAIGTLLTGELFSREEVQHGGAYLTDYVHRNNVHSKLEGDFSINLFGNYFNDCLDETFTCYGAKYFSEKHPYLFAVTMGRRAFNTMMPCFMQGRLPVRLRKLLHADCNVEQGQSSDVQQFETFVDSIKANEAYGRIHHFHSLLTHTPYVFDEKGRRHSLPPAQEAFGPGADVDLVWQSYTKQAMFADSLLGTVIAKLKSEGLYDEAIIIITADHGTSSIAETSASSDEEIADYIAWVPLIIRSPTLSPGVSDVDYQHVDFRPTLLELLGEEPEQDLEGVSAFSDQRPERDKVFYYVGHDLKDISKFVYDSYSQQWRKDARDVVGASPSQ